MLMKSGERWHCANPACRCEVLVESDGQVPGASPRCACGGALQKNYVPPVFRYLDFLRDEDSPELQRQAADR
jgi:hypothetical protein